MLLCLLKDTSKKKLIFINFLCISGRSENLPTSAIYILCISGLGQIILYYSEIDKYAQNITRQKSLKHLHANKFPKANDLLNNLKDEHSLSSLFLSV